MEKKKYRLPKRWTEEKWFPALLSGEYEQGMEYLYYPPYEDDIIGKVPGQYCCLGVTGVVCGIPKDSLAYQVMIEQDKTSYDQYLVQEANKYGYPNELISLQCEQQYIDLPNQLADLNDTGSTFAEIIEWIKENVELYDEESGS